MKRGVEGLRFSFAWGAAGPLLFVLFLFVAFSGTAFAGRPLITDDTSTQGKGGYLLEMGYEYNKDDTDGGRVRRDAGTVEVDYGLADPVDLIVSTAYQALQINNPGDTSSPGGVTDTLVELKWRFYENRKGLSFAIKPGTMLPTGNYTLGEGSGDYRFGTGQMRPRLYFVATQYAGPFAFHVNLGYMRNYNRYDAATDLWHASIAGEWRMMKKLRLVCNTGIDTNPEKGTSTDPSFVLGGVIYTVTERVEVDFGVKYALGEPGYDAGFTTGISIKF